MSANRFSFPPKYAVRRSFGKAANTYDGNAFLQCEIANRLFERLEYMKLDPKLALDIGCGTGHATARLRERFADADIIALDIAEPMLAVAQRQTKPLAWLQRIARRSARQHCEGADRGARQRRTFTCRICRERRA